jgi:cytochrome b561
VSRNSPPPPGAAGPRYDRASILLHWATAVLVLLLWGVAQVIDLFPKGEPKIAVRSVHIVLGAALAVVLSWRLAWRIGWGRRLPPDRPGLLHQLARFGHLGLYALLAATVMLGLANAWVRGDTITGLFTIPPLAPGDKALKKLVADLHGTCANLILIAAGLHAAAALLHHFVLHDGVLRRMWPARRRQ